MWSPAAGRASALFWIGVATAMAIAVAVDAPSESIEAYPQHTRLPVGAQIRYSVFHDRDGSLRQVEEYDLLPDNSDVVRVVDRWRLEAVAPGSTEVLIQTGVGDRVLSIDVDPAPRSPMPARPFSEVQHLGGEEVLFVGHANLDGMDHTAVAKAGIDRLVRDFKARGHPVIYFVSEEYPFWYTEDRQPDLAIVSEGQEHGIVVDAGLIVFSGGDFMFCTLRNAQMTLHGLLQSGRRERIHLVFPADGIWAADIFSPDRYRPYPAPMVLLDDLLAAGDSHEERYEQVVVPFLDRLFGDFPVIGYPAVAPQPALDDLADGWSIEVAFDGRVERSYRQGDPDRLILFEFVSGPSRQG